MVADAEFVNMLGYALRISAFGLCGQFLLLKGFLMVTPVRRSPAIYGGYMVCKEFLYIFLLRGFLLPLYAGEPWLNSLQVGMDLFFQILTILLLWYCFAGSLAKNLLTVEICEIVVCCFLYPAMIFLNWKDGASELMGIGRPLNPLDQILVLVVPVLLFSVVCRLAKPLLLRYRTFRFRREGLVRFLALAYMEIVMVGNVASAYPFEFSHLSSAAIASAVFLLLAFFLMIRRSNARIRMEREFLLKQRKLMGTQYRVMQEQIRLVQRHQEEIDGQMAQIQNMEWNAGAREQIRQYLRALQQEYQKIHAGNYCRDWAVDAVLYSETEKASAQGVRLTCDLANYDRGGLPETLVAETWYLLLEWGLREIGKMRAQLRLSTVRAKGQMMTEIHFRDGEKDRCTAARKELQPGAKNGGCHPVGTLRKKNGKGNSSRVGWRNSLRQRHRMRTIRRDLRMLLGESLNALSLQQTEEGFALRLMIQDTTSASEPTCKA